MHRALLAAVLLVSPACYASPHDVIVGLDAKAVWGPDSAPAMGEPGKDAVIVMDVADPLHPVVRATIPLENSALGPPTNLQIAPDGRLALIAPR